MNVTAVGWQWEAKWLWSASEDGTLRVWDIRVSGRASGVREYKAKHAINDACLDPEQCLLTSVDDRGVLRTWDLAGKECVSELVPDEIKSSPLPVPLQTVSCSPDGTFIACCDSRVPFFFFRTLHQHHQRTQLFRVGYTFIESLIINWSSLGRLIQPI